MAHKSIRLLADRKPGPQPSAAMLQMPHPRPKARHKTDFACYDQQLALSRQPLTRLGTSLLTPSGPAIPYHILAPSDMQFHDSHRRKLRYDLAGKLPAVPPSSPRDLYQMPDGRWIYCKITTEKVTGLRKSAPCQPRLHFEIDEQFECKKMKVP